MKHTLKITIILLALFFSTQIIGLIITKHFNENPLPYDIQRPELEKETSFLPIFIIILVGTGLLLLIIKLKIKFLWKAWFFLSVLITLSIAFSSFLNQILSAIISLALTFFKVIKRNIIIHNFTELLIYGGLAAILAPLFSIFSISILLILISIYDYLAVRKTKHMVKLAKFQSEEKLFAGFFIPYKKSQAILGGGDIALPMIFAAVLMLKYGYWALITPIVTTLALFYLFYTSEKKKFYPAMPILTIGCFISYFIIILTQV